MNCSTPGSSVLHYLPEFAQIHSHWVKAAIQPSHPLSSPCPPALNVSQHQSLFQWVSSSHQEAKYWSFSFSISPSDEYSGWISFRINWFDLLPPKGLTRVFQAFSPPIFLWVLFLRFEAPDPYSFLLSSREDMSLSCLNVLSLRISMGLPYEANWIS